MPPLEASGLSCFVVKELVGTEEVPYVDSKPGLSARKLLNLMGRE